MFGILSAEFAGGCILMYVKNCCLHLRNSANVTGLVSFTFNIKLVNVKISQSILQKCYFTFSVAPGIGIKLPASPFDCKFKIY